MHSKILTSFLVAGVLLTGSVVLHADPTNTPAPGANAAPPKPAAQPRMRPLPGAPAAGSQNPLTEEQLASYKKNIADKSAQMADLNSKRMAARQEIGQLIYSPKLDESLLRQKVMDEAKIEADIAVLQAKAFSEIQPPVTAEQFEKLKESMAPRQPMIRPIQPPPAAPSTTTTNH